MQVKLQLARLLNGCNRVPLARDDLAGYSFQHSTLWKLSIITMKNVRTSYKYRKSFVLQLTPYNLHITENPKDFFTQHIIHTPYDNYTIKNAQFPEFKNVRTSYNISEKLCPATNVIQSAYNGKPQRLLYATHIIHTSYDNHTIKNAQFSEFISRATLQQPYWHLIIRKSTFSPYTNKYNNAKPASHRAHRRERKSHSTAWLKWITLPILRRIWPTRIRSFSAILSPKPPFYPAVGNSLRQHPIYPFSKGKSRRQAAAASWYMDCVLRKSRRVGVFLWRKKADVYLRVINQV